jgi:hypothetical protein
MIDRFEAQLADTLRWTNEVAPDAAVHLLERKLRQIHGDRPDLSMSEILIVAFDVLEGEGVEAPVAMEQARERAHEAAVSEARFAAMQRIAERAGDLDALEAQFPGRGTIAEMLAVVGHTWADLGLSEEDGMLAEEIRRGMRRPQA